VERSLSLLLPWLGFVAWTGCSAPELAPSGLVFVEGGVIVDGGVEAGGRPLAEGRELLERSWTPGEALEIQGRTGFAAGTAPSEPECFALFRITLGAAAQVEVAFHPDGHTLEIRADSQPVRVLDSWTGRAMGRLPLSSATSRSVELPAGCPHQGTVVTTVSSEDGRWASVEDDGEASRIAVFR
jgi:hypothetical protein